MPFDSTGAFNRLRNWGADAAAGIKIRADFHDSEDDNFAQGLSTCITKDGRTQPTANLPMNNKRLINLAAPVNDSDAVTKAYVDGNKTYPQGIDISGADNFGKVNFKSATGSNGFSWTGADLSWIAKLATAAVVGPPAVPATLNRLVLNDKPDGSGTDVVEFRDDGSALFKGLLTGVNADFTNTITVRGASPLLAIRPTTGNGHVWFYNADGTQTRAIIYTDSGAQGNLIFSVGSANVQVTPAGRLLGSPGWQVDTNGNIIGSVWNNWGSTSAYDAINARIEARAQAWADAKVNNAVTSTRSAGFLDMTINQGGSGGGGETSGYWVSGVWTTPINSAIRVTSRQPQVYIPNIGWMVAFNF